MDFNDLFVNIQWADIWTACGETLYMVAISTLFTALIGLPLGVLVVLTSPGHLLQNRLVYAVLSFIINIFRSIPFIILLIMLIPFTQILVGTSIGVTAAIPPLVIGSAPFFARLVEVSLREVDKGVIEMAQSMGATTWQIISRVLLPEARSGIIAGITITLVALVGYTAMAGVIGGGGLGDLAIRFGYQRFQTDVMIVTTVIMIVLVQVFQTLGDKLVRRFNRK
ncbi:methionine ABC transporter permease [Tumebacillus flagellatus]|uniref:Metal ABC transporter permease n=1 Tax=Tumebacillus flagellatus TaxID=1157490 RepID=A0A074LJA4_9BACL|nr:methionine ABC transporter permease [Tumebacillus flagellatus]KEO82266.1 metal ABC transporter permease [Tumebacillus flagellatus]